MSRHHCTNCTNSTNPKEGCLSVVGLCSLCGLCSGHLRAAMPLGFVQRGDAMSRRARARANARPWETDEAGADGVGDDLVRLIDAAAAETRGDDVPLGGSFPGGSDAGCSGLDVALADGSPKGVVW